MKVSGNILLFILILGGVSAPRCGATVYNSNGSAANVQALHNLASEGDTIKIPAGTFSWTSRLNITKGITLQGATTIVGTTWSPAVTDTTIIQDNTPRSGPRAGIISAQLNANQSFRLTGITFTHGATTAYGPEGFWFVEDNTIRGNGPVTSGAIDCVNGGRYVARHNTFFNASPGGHGTEGGPQRGARTREVYDNAFHWTIGWGGHGQRSGGGIWHDNAWTGNDSNNQNHSVLALYREIGAIGNHLNDWGLAGGNNP